MEKLSGTAIVGCVNQTFHNKWVKLHRRLIGLQITTLFLPTQMSFSTPERHTQ
jgi:hypothetical protein